IRARESEAEPAKAPAKELAAIAAAVTERKPAPAPQAQPPAPEKAAAAPPSPGAEKPVVTPPASPADIAGVGINASSTPHRVEGPPEKPSPPATIPARETEDTKPAAPLDPKAPVVVDVRHQGESVRVTFPFAQPTPAAMFRRADTLWLVFDSQ